MSAPAPTQTIREVTTTYHTEALAQAAARQLVERRLAACVHVEGPVSSTYWWDGKVQSEPEWRLTAKTSTDKVAQVMAALDRDHPYDLPALLVHAPETTDAFAEWVREETRQSPAD